MKKTSELRLEVIQLEDQVLLVETKVGGGKLNDWVKLSIPKIERVEEWNQDLVGFCNKIIASTKPLEGLPLLVIEVERKEGYFFTQEELNEYTQCVIKQALETAAEKVKIIEEELGSDECNEPVDTLESCEFIADKGYEECSFYRYTASKQSITNTFEETFKKFEV